MLDTLLAATAIAAMLAAAFSARSAFLTYRLSKKIQDDLKADEIVITGPLLNPSLPHETHSNCVVVCTLFNKSRRKAYVHSVRAMDEDREAIDISWASSIDQHGNPQEPFGLVGLIDSVNLYVRRKDGQGIDCMSLEIGYSLPNSPATVTYKPWRRLGLVDDPSWTDFHYRREPMTPEEHGCLTSCTKRRKRPAPLHAISVDGP